MLLEFMLVGNKVKALALALVSKAIQQQRALRLPAHLQYSLGRQQRRQQIAGRLLLP